MYDVVTLKNAITEIQKKIFLYPRKNWYTIAYNIGERYKYTVIEYHGGEHIKIFPLYHPYVVIWVYRYKIFVKTLDKHNMKLNINDQLTKIVNDLMKECNDEDDIAIVNFEFNKMIEQL